MLPVLLPRAAWLGCHPDDVLAFGYWDESGPTDRHAGRHGSLLNW